MNAPSLRVVGTLDDLPDSAPDARSLTWWGTIAFMAIEGMGFVVAAGAYFLLMGRADHWPPAGPPPTLVYGTVFTIVMVLSELPNVLLEKAAKTQGHDTRIRVLMIVLSIIGIGLCAVRAYEFTTLNTSWKDHAYGSIQWTLLALHTIHIVTETVETFVLTVLTFTHEIDGRRRTDLSDDGLYWHFVVLTWLPIYVLIYWVPRWIG